MTKHDEISSTEKLLDLIRGKSVKGSVLPVLSPSPDSAGGVKASLLKRFSLKKKTVVGVDISRKDLRLVKISLHGEQKAELLNYSHTPFDPSIKKNSPRFLLLLKSALKTFCDTSGQHEIWSTVSSANVETRYLRIPKVSKKQISNAVYWTYKKDISFNEQNEVFDYDILGDIIEDGIAKIEVMAYSAQKQEVNELSNLFYKSGYPLTGISMVPFALQNLFRTRWVEDGNSVCSLFVGSDWSRIAIFSNGNLILSRDIKAGIQSMLEAVREEIGRNQPERSEQSRPLDSSDETALLEDFNENYDVDMDKAHELLFGLIDNTLPLSEKKAPDSNSENVFRMILPALDRVTRQIEKTIRHYYLNFVDDQVKKIFVSGKISTNRLIVDYISHQLNLPVENIDPFVPGSFSSVDVSAPESESDRGSFVPSVGLALSSNDYTPNFIFTYKDKDKFAFKLLVKRLVIGAALLLITLTIGFSLWQSIILDQKKAGIAQLQRQMEQYIPVVDENLIVSMAAKTKRNIDAAESFVTKYWVMAMISEITQITPSDIRLSSITADLGWPKGYQPSPKKGPGQKKLLKLEGAVLGEQLTFEASLAGYLVKLKSSPMFSRTAIIKKDYVLFEGQEVLRFTAQLELIRN